MNKLNNELIKENSFNNIAIMTSGGDSPGMNMVVTSLLRLLFNTHKNCYIVYDGIRGLLDNTIELFDYSKFKEYVDAIFLSGTLIRSSRVPEFKEPQNVIKAVNNLKKNGIDLLIVIGGDGSLNAANDLSCRGIKVLFIPATIDNDVSSTDYTIGYSSALNLILNNVYAIRNTVKSFNSFCLIEVMGRECSDLSVNTALATFADGIITKENPWTVQDFCNKINTIKKNGKNWGFFLVTEKYYGLNGHISYSEIVKEVEEKTHIHMKFDSIGYAQRGATPTAEELVKSFNISKYCVDLLLKGEYNLVLGWLNMKLTKWSFNDAMRVKKNDNLSEIELINCLAELNFYNK